MYILGLNIGHNATACLLKDGKILGCVSEERFSRIKNHHGIPYASIDWLMKEFNLSLEEVEIVLDDQYQVEGNANFGKNFLQVYKNPSQAKKIKSWLGYTYPSGFKAYYDWKSRIQDKQDLHKRIKNQVAAALDVAKEKITVIDHHLTHAFSPLGNLDENIPWLIFTLDGEGSGLCATVNLYQDKMMKVISQSSKTASLGYFYGIATLMLGMKPLEHEFKVMGLAPYAKKHAVEEIYLKLRELFSIDEDLQFHSKFSMPFADHFFKKEM